MDPIRTGEMAIYCALDLEEKRKEVGGDMMEEIAKLTISQAVIVAAIIIAAAILLSGK